MSSQPSVAPVPVDDGQPTPEVQRGARRPRRAFLRANITAYLFLAVPLILILAVEVIPMLGVFWMSMVDYNPFDPSSWRDFVGLANYQRMISDPLVWQSLVNTFYFALLYMPVAIFGALVAAVLLNQKLRGRLVFRGVYFMPVIVSWVVGATMIMWFLDPSAGLVSLMLERLGFDRLPQLLQRSTTAMPTVAFVAVWKYFGYNTVIYLAGLQTIDQGLEEAARIDGASAVQRFWHLTLPMLRPVTAVVITINLIQALRIFDPMIIMTNGGPNFSTTSTVLYFYRIAWDSLQFGYGSAITALLSVIIFTVGGLQFWILSRRSTEL